MVLVSEYGNVRKQTDNPLEIERLKELGYKEYVEQKSVPKPKKPKTEKK